MDKKLTFNEKAAIFITQIGGDMKTFWTFGIVYAVWILWNLFMPKTLRFDGDWFPLLLFISNFIQLQYLPAIQTGQNLQGEKSEKRAIEDHEMIKKEFSELKELLELERSENAELHMIFDELSKVLNKINKN